MDTDKKFKNGFVCGAFDLFHAGHALLLEECKEHCEKLIVGLQTDPTIDRKEKNKPIQTMYERFVQLAMTGQANIIVPYDTEEDLMNMLATLDINVRFLGSDYVGKRFTGDLFCETQKIPIIYIDRLHNYSTSSLRKRIVNAARDL